MIAFSSSNPTADMKDIELNVLDEEMTLIVVLTSSFRVSVFNAGPLSATDSPTLRHESFIIFEYHDSAASGPALIFELKNKTKSLVETPGVTQHDGGGKGVRKLNTFFSLGRSDFQICHRSDIGKLYAMFTRLIHSPDESMYKCPDIDEDPHLQELFDRLKQVKGMFIEKMDVVLIRDESNLISPPPHAVMRPKRNQVPQIYWEVSGSR